ncbi:Uncharacterized protein APZ42_008047, partial [Daphnia magna]
VFDARRERLDVAIGQIQGSAFYLANGSGFVCGSLESPAAKIRKLDSTTKCGGSECLLPELVQSSSVRFSALCLDSAVPGQDQERESRSGVNLPFMVFAALVAAAVGNGNRHSACLPVSSSATALERFTPTSASAVGQVPLVRLDVIWRRFQERGFSPQVIELLLASSRFSTANAY